MEGVLCRGQAVHHSLPPAENSFHYLLQGVKREVLDSIIFSVSSPIFLGIEELVQYIFYLKYHRMKKSFLS